MRKEKKISAEDSFENLARRIGADQSGSKFERAFKKIAPPKKPKPVLKIKKKKTGSQ